MIQIVPARQSLEAPHRAKRGVIVATVCNTTTKYTQYFDNEDARCHDCGDTTAIGAALFCVLFAVLIVMLGDGAANIRCTGCARACGELRTWTRAFHTIWQRAGMRNKVKALVGLYQCLAAIPSAFNVSTPEGLEEYTKWINLLEWPADFGVDIAIPAACFGSYQDRLFIGSSWPLVLLLIAGGGFIGVEIARDCWSDSPTPRGARSAWRAGLLRTLPIVFVLTFVLVPSTSTRIFKTFMCDSFEYDHSTGEMHRFLHDDLNLSCDTDEYSTTQTVALVMMLIWPVQISEQLEPSQPSLLCLHSLIIDRT